MEMFSLTHPEVLSDFELWQILENCCININDYKHLSRYQLIELYKQMAMPLPKRKDSDNNKNEEQKKKDLDNNKSKKQETEDLANECQSNVVSSNGTSNTKRSINEIKSYPSSCSRNSKSPVNELERTPKKIQLYNSNNLKDYNGIGKRRNDEKNDESPSKKRQKITWP